MNNNEFQQYAQNHYFVGGGNISNDPNLRALSSRLFFKYLNTYMSMTIPFCFFFFTLLSSILATFFVSAYNFFILRIGFSLMLIFLIFFSNFSPFSLSNASFKCAKQAYGFSFSLLYCLFKYLYLSSIRSINTKFPVPLAATHPHTMTDLPSCFTV